MPKKYFYKITRKDQSSAVVIGDLSVKYKVGKFVKAPKGMRDIGYHLLVFHSHSDAVDFIGTQEVNSMVIWRCECKDILPTILPRLLIRDPRRILKYPEIPIKWPKGTVMVKEVKLLKQAVKNKIYEPKNKPNVNIEENKAVKKVLTMRKEDSRIYT